VQGFIERGQAGWFFNLATHRSNKKTATAATEFVWQDSAAVSEPKPLIKLASNVAGATGWLLNFLLPSQGLGILVAAGLHKAFQRQIVLPLSSSILTFTNQDKLHSALILALPR
jgi:hypothetical protein